MASILGSISALIEFWPYQYILALWNLVFATCIIVIEAKPQWSCVAGAQSWLFSHAPFLSRHMGRALFYIYVGSINLGNGASSFFFQLMYLAIGGALCFVGGLMLLQHSMVCDQHESDSTEAHV